MVISIATVHGRASYLMRSRGRPNWLVEIAQRAGEAVPYPCEDNCLREGAGEIAPLSAQKHFPRRPHHSPTPRLSDVLHMNFLLSV
jgi:hypothetical protein